MGRITEVSLWPVASFSCAANCGPFRRI